MSTLGLVRYINCQASILGTLEHILLLTFELLLCFKLENPNGEIEGVQLSWVLVFSPLFIQSFVAMVISIWCIRNDKLFEVGYDSLPLRQCFTQF